MFKKMLAAIGIIACGVWAMPCNQNPPEFVPNVSVIVIGIENAEELSFGIGEFTYTWVDLGDGFGHTECGINPPVSFTDIQSNGQISIGNNNLTKNLHSIFFKITPKEGYVAWVNGKIFEDEVYQYIPSSLPIICISGSNGQDGGCFELEISFFPKNNIIIGGCFLVETPVNVIVVNEEVGGKVQYSKSPFEKTPFGKRFALNDSCDSLEILITTNEGYVAVVYEDGKITKIHGSGKYRVGGSGVAKDITIEFVELKECIMPPSINNATAFVSGIEHAEELSFNMSYFDTQLCNWVYYKNFIPIESDGVRFIANNTGQPIGHKLRFRIIPKEGYVALVNDEIFEGTYYELILPTNIPCRPGPTHICADIEISFVPKNIGCNNWTEWSNWIRISNPNCTENGFEIRTRVCLDNGEVDTDTRIIPALGHIWQWETTIAPTCESDGKAERICLRDPTHAESIIIPRLTGDECKDIIPGFLVIADNPAREKAEISVIMPSNETLAVLRIVILDAVGNIVFEQESTDATPDNPIVWNLLNKSGRLVSSGTY